MSFLPSPLHPAIVHLPIALAVLVPLFAIGAVLAIKRGAPSQKTWAIPFALIALLLVSGWASLQTGKRDEDRAERVLGEAPIESHEEAAEGFLVATGVVLLLAGAGFARGQVGTAARGVAVVGTIALMGAGYNVGHTGGALVYRNGSAMAFVGGGDGGAAAATADAGGDDDDDDDDR